MMGIYIYFGANQLEVIKKKKVFKIPKLLLLLLFLLRKLIEKCIVCQWN